MGNNQDNTNPVNEPTPDVGQPGRQPIPAEPPAQSTANNPVVQPVGDSEVTNNNTQPVNNPQNANSTGANPNPPNSSAPENNYFGLTGSQLQPDNQKIPTGIYVIAGLMLIGFLASLFDTSQNSGIYSVVLFFDLLLAGGLLLRYEIARKIIVWVSVITIVLTAVGVFMQIALQQRIQELKNNYDSEISKIDQNRLTTAQKEQLEKLDADIAEREKQVGKVITLTYVKFAITLLASGAAVVYLTRPKVKEVFHELKA